MKRLIVVAVVLGLVAAVGKAGIITDPAQGALWMTLSFDAAGNAWLTKNTDYDTGPLDIDLYEIWSDGDKLDLVGWKSIADSVKADPTAVVAALGADALSFGEFKNIGPGVLAEVNISGAATFQPNAPWSIGKPLVPPPSIEDLSFYYTRPDFIGNKFLGEVVPEPATLAMMAIGGLSLIAVGRSRSRRNQKRRIEQ